jgi:CheY-like chemotaxis protein
MDTMPHILVIDDDREIRDLLRASWNATASASPRSRDGRRRAAPGRSATTSLWCWT